MTATRRPGFVSVLLLAFFAAVMVISFARGEFQVAWFAGLGGSFLTMELWHARVKSGDTFSEDWWSILGIRPPRSHRALRSAFAGVFILELCVHIISGGQFWFCGGTAIISTAVPLALVCGYSLLFERKAQNKEVMMFGFEFGGIKTWFIRKFARGPLENLQKDLQSQKEGGKPMKLSPAVKAVLWFVGLVILQAGWDYYGLDKTPTFAESLRYVGGALIASALFWTKSGRLPNLDEVKAGLAEKGNISIANDNPNDPVRVIVDGTAVPKAIVLESLINPAAK